MRLNSKSLPLRCLNVDCPVPTLLAVIFSLIVIALPLSVSCIPADCNSVLNSRFPPLFCRNIPTPPPMLLALFTLDPPVLNALQPALDPPKYPSYTSLVVLYLNSPGSVFGRCAVVPRGT